MLPISDKSLEAAEEVTTRLAEAGVRVSLDSTSDKVGAKIRNARMERIPYMLVLGAKEVEEGTVSVRHRDREDLGTMPLDRFIAEITAEIRERAL